MLQCIFRVEVVDFESGETLETSVFFSTKEAAKFYAEAMGFKDYYIKKYWLKND